MKRCQEHFGSYFPFDTLPLEIFERIHDNLDASDKVNLRKVSMSMLRDCSSLARSICFLPPKIFSDAPENIYQELLERYPNISKITFQSNHRCGGNRSNEKQIRALIAFLTNNKDEHPLSHIRKLDIQEIDWHDMLDPALAVHTPHIADIKELNRSFLNALSHDKLESVVWRTFDDCSCLTGQEIQPILEKSLNLKHFQLAGSIPFHKLHISFEKQSQLASVIFKSDLLVDDKTITSLSKSQKLKTLSFGCHHRDSSLEFTKQMPNLEFLTICNRFPLNENKLESLGINCPRLKELRIDKLELNNDGIARLIQGLFKLEVLIFKEPHQIEEDALIESIKENCPKMDIVASRSVPPDLKQWILCSTLNPTPKLI